MPGAYIYFTAVVFKSVISVPEVAKSGGDRSLPVFAGITGPNDMGAVDPLSWHRLTA